MQPNQNEKTIDQKQIMVKRCNGDTDKTERCNKHSKVFNDAEFEIVITKHDASNLSVQGSFNQADEIFGENAGTQCVANSLTALAYQKVKKSEEWQTHDMNKILTTGDEMYTFLQRSSSMMNRYLLVNELPQFFECFEKLFEFRSNESLPSLINLGNVELNYADFNAYEMFEALQIALDDTKGCFVCFHEDKPVP